MSPDRCLSGKEGKESISIKKNPHEQSKLLGMENPVYYIKGFVGGAAVEFPGQSILNRFIF